MRKVSTAELREKEIINLCTGEKLGYPTDFDIDLDECRVISMFVSKSCGFSLFDKSEEIMIPWCRIECIGEDAILVKLTDTDLSGNDRFCRTKKKGRLGK